MKNTKMSTEKKIALSTLTKIKNIYEDGGHILTGSFYTEFMELVNRQIDEIERTTI